ncbi:MAG TPA: hypothetical protein VGV39_06565 [Mesorhizobium sp.]|uniref:hypothetical protein n=1 Tax=Mesorhizobium sp. TaxID=1871066 RepID=UPI002DDD5EF9|nr:hypothetical protein [Mesorhizobium sp.]HEV2502718.1 hypothetical protein [Mesorhizobium sp.]
MASLGSKGMWILITLWFAAFVFCKASLDDRNWRVTIFFGALTVFGFVAIVYLSAIGDTWR